jgi:hypothetical protein
MMNTVTGIIVFVCVVVPFAVWLWSEIGSHPSKK